MKPLLGGKGANLAEMTRIGLPVPPGFTITTEVCTYYYANKRTYPPALREPDGGGHRRAWRSRPARSSAIAKNPLLVSVRSGARDSMPGMMDTILNLGLNDETVEALASQDQQRALRVGLLPPLRPDVRRRGDGRAEAAGRGSRAVRDGDGRLKHERYHQDIEDTELTADDLKELVSASRRSSRSAPARSSRASPWEQLLGAIGAVFGSWMNERAIVYRRKYNIPTEWGTAVNVQAWSSATPATTPDPASPSRATRPTARTSSTASSSSTRRAKTSSPACARRSRSPS